MKRTILPGSTVGTLLTTGEEVFDRAAIVNSSLALSGGALRLTYFTARKTESITQVRVITGAVAAAATPTLIRFGVYSIDGAGAGTLVASTTNDTTLLAATSTAYTKALSSTWSKTAGTRYAFAGLVVTGATAPQMCGVTYASSSEAAIAPRLTGLLSGQSDLPSSFADASVSATTARVYAALLP